MRSYETNLFRQNIPYAQRELWLLLASDRWRVQVRMFQRLNVAHTFLPEHKKIPASVLNASLSTSKFTKPRLSLWVSWSRILNQTYLANFSFSISLQILLNCFYCLWKVHSLRKAIRGKGVVQNSVKIAISLLFLPCAGFEPASRDEDH